MSSEAATARPSVVKSFVRHYRNEDPRRIAARGGELPAARDMSPGALVDHIPGLLEEIADIADEVAGEGDVPTARNHAMDRLARGFDVTLVVRELSMLRGAAMTVWSREVVEGNVAELRALDLAIDRAIAISVRTVRERLADAVSDKERRSPSSSRCSRRRPPASRFSIATCGTCESIARLPRSTAVPSRRTSAARSPRFCRSGAAARAAVRMCWRPARRIRNLEVTGAVPEGQRYGEDVPAQPSGAGPSGVRRGRRWPRRRRDRVQARPRSGPQRADAHAVDHRSQPRGNLGSRIPRGGSCSRITGSPTRSGLRMKG